MPLWGRYWVPFIHDAEVKENGETIVSEGKGEPLLIEGKLTDTKGNQYQMPPSISGIVTRMDFMIQYEDREKADLREELSKLEKMDHLLLKPQSLYHILFQVMVQSVNFEKNQPSPL